MDKQIDMFPIGSVVYYIKDDYRAGDNRYSVDFGIVSAHYSKAEIEIEIKYAIISLLADYNLA